MSTQTCGTSNAPAFQCDEVWSFCYAKERNLKRELRGTGGVGDIWTWTAIDPDTKLTVSWHLGKRSRDDPTACLAGSGLVWPREPETRKSH